MKINKLFILLLSLMLFILSCGSQMPFDPRAYNKGPKNTEGIKEAEDDGQIIDVPSGSEDPFEKPGNNKPDAGGFDRDEMKDWFITAKFLDGNIPEYQFLKSGRTWTAGNVSKNESHYYGGETTALGYGVSGVEYYRYMGKNPMYPPTGGYNTGAHGKRIERFVFYRFTGKALGTISLDNLLVAVDTYTKLVFAYGEPKDPDSFGNPGTWAALDYGTKYKFYEYDPVGIMRSDGSVMLYEWFKENQRNSRYNPDKYYMHGYPNVADASGPGKSPYLPGSVVIDNFITAVKGKTFEYRDNNNSLMLHKYAFSADGKTITYEKFEWKKDNPVFTDTFSGYTQIGPEKGSYGGIEFFIKDNASELHKGNDIAGYYNYQDPGPRFCDRVAGKKYLSIDKSYSYEFSADGKSCVFTWSSGEKATYTYDMDKSGDRTQAAYKQQTWVFWAFRLSNNDTKIECSTATLGSGGDILNTAIYGAWIAYLSSDGSGVELDQFLIRTQGKTFSFRDPNNTLMLHQYTFSGSGKDVTYKKLEWRNPVPLETKTYTGYIKINDNNAKYKVDNNNGSLGAEIKFTLQNNATEFVKENDGYRYITDYNDPGPLYLLRVAGATYKNGAATYTFSADGKTMEYVSGSTKETYKFQRQRSTENRRQAVYRRTAGGFWGSQGDYGYSLEDRDGKVDHYIWCTTWVGNGTEPPWSGSSTGDAYRE